MFNFARQSSGGGVAGKWMQGTVVKNDDSKEDKGKRALRCRVRVEHFHDEIPDEMLPWMGPDSNTHGTANGGTVGGVKVPPVGTKVWVKFSNETLYHGTYGGTVNNPNASPNEFTGDDNGNDDSSSSGGGGGGTAQADDDGNGLDQESIDDYPNVVGNVDPSGHKTAVNNKRDTIDLEHVTGTKVNLDGVGNLSATVNQKEGLNPDAKKKFSDGASLMVVKDLNILVSGKCAIGSKGNMTIVSEGDLTIGAKGKLKLASKGDMSLDGANVYLNTMGVAVPALPQVSTPPNRKRPKIADPSGQGNGGGGSEP